MFPIPPRPCETFFPGISNWSQAQKTVDLRRKNSGINVQVCSMLLRFKMGKPVLSEQRVCGYLYAFLKVSPCLTLWHPALPVCRSRRNWNTPRGKSSQSDVVLGIPANEGAWWPPPTRVSFGRLLDDLRVQRSPVRCFALMHGYSERALIVCSKFAPNTLGASTNSAQDRFEPDKVISGRK